MKMRFKLILFLLAMLPIHEYSGMLLAQGSSVTAGEAPTSRILFIFDASNSMAGQWEGERKIDRAREVLFEMLDTLEQMSNLELALRVYGHQSPVSPQDCSDTKLEVPFSPNNVTQIRQTLNEIQPKGTTPIAHSLELAPEDFPLCGTCRNIIVLITDGIEACDGDPCSVSLNLQRKGIILRPFVIGIGSDPGFRETFDCIGEYYDAPTQDEYREALKEVITQALNATSAQVNLLDSKSIPTETDVNVIFYDRYTGAIRYHMIHTLDRLGNPDTLSLDPMVTYDLEVQTIPSVRLDSVRLMAGRHNTISIDTPQGFLYVRTKRGNSYDRDQFLVKRAGEQEVINIQETGTVGKYLVGSYDLLIPIYPKMKVHGVEIRQSNTTTVEIPAPGYVTFNTGQRGAGSLYQLDPSGQQSWVMNLLENTRTQGYYLQPGSYQVVFRRNDHKSSSFTKIRNFTVKEGSPQTIKFY
ncbi:MAG: VWA domain-containing protein [Bacteroidales bacterium]|nr:VWA domain-containing protein [Bacteroidales bacterium]